MELSIGDLNLPLPDPYYGVLVEPALVICLEVNIPMVELLSFK